MKAHRLVTAAFVILVSLAVWQTASTPAADLFPDPTTTTIDTLPDRVAHLEAELKRVEREVYLQGVDQQAVWVRIERIAAERAAVDDVWRRLAQCESGMTNAATGNGYWGFFQFSLSTWRGIGGSGYPHHHSYEVQKSFARKLQARSGWGQWPACSRKLGLR